MYLIERDNNDKNYLELIRQIGFTNNDIAIELCNKLDSESSYDLAKLLSFINSAFLRLRAIRKNDK